MIPYKIREVDWRKIVEFLNLTAFWSSLLKHKISEKSMALPDRNDFAYRNIHGAEETLFLLPAIGKIPFQKFFHVFFVCKVTNYVGSMLYCFI